MIRGLWLVMIGLLRFFIEVLLFLPRYLFIERHDRSSPFWGVRAEAVVCFVPASSLNVVNRIGCLNCPESAKRVLSATRYRGNSVNITSSEDEHEAVMNEDLNSFSISSTTSPRHTLLDGDGNGSDVWTEHSRNDTSAAAMMDTLSRWLRSTSAIFMGTQRLSCGRAAMAAAMSTVGDDHILHGVFTSGTTFLHYSLLQNASVEGDAQEKRHHTSCMRRDYQQGMHLRGRNGDKLFCCFSGDSNEAESIHVPYRMYSRGLRERKGFIPPWYAVHAKAQLILSLIDPLWRIITGLFFVPHAEKESGSESQHSQSSTQQTETHVRRRHGGLEKRPRRMSASASQTFSCMFTESQPTRRKIPDPSEEVCFIPEQAARALWARSHTTRQETIDEAPPARGHVPTLTSAQLFLKHRTIKTAPTGKKLEGVSRSDVAEESPCHPARSSTKSKRAVSGKSQREAKTEEHDTTHAATAGSASGARITSVHWLRGSAPPDASDSATSVIVLLLCPSVTQGNEHGFMARRMGALCEALTNISKLRRQSSQNSCNCRRRYSHQTQLGIGPPDGSKTTTMTDATDPHFASWHAAIPVVEMISWPSGQSSEHAPLPASSLCRERVNVTVEDIGQILSHLERLRAPSAYSSRDTNDATMEVHRDVVLASVASMPSMSRSGSYLQSDGRVAPRNLYIVGVGWSNASSPLLQYVMLYGAQSRIDGIICINQTASSNYALVPETVSNSQRKLRTLGRDRQWSARSHKTPFHSTFLLAPAGATRLLLLAARLHLTADRLLELQKKRQRRCQKIKKGDVLCAENDAAIWDYLRRTVGNCASGDHESRTAKDATFYPALSSTCHLSSRSLLSSAESPLDFLLQVEAQVDEEMNSWWIDDVQAGNDDDDESTRGRSLSSRGDRAAPFLSSGGWHSPMGLLDWDKLLKNQQNVSAATRTGIGFSGRHTLPSSPHVTSNDTLNAEVVEASHPKNDDRAEPAKTTAGNDDENVCGEEIIPPSHAPARRATPPFEMARGGPDLLLSAHLLSPLSQNFGDTPRKFVAPKRMRYELNARPVPSQNSALEVLFYRSASSAHLVSLIHVPTLFVHANDDEMAPLSTLPMRELASNPYVFTVLTRRGGYGVFLEGISTLYKLPRLTLQEREKAMHHNKSLDGDEDCRTSKTRHWLPQWVPLKRRNVKLTSTMKVNDSCFVPPITSTNKKKKGMKNDVETVFIIENTTWLEQLIVEFVATTVIV
ncbi:hypothetical protein ECC02_003000 [Trypanosoma cruzi]|uniref:Uncharacterized protein n=1 Tax=Trypanosoma cruzi TaxID=5693 RepID=A0A7J6YBM3_TRYCR|nr:hypothetical protein ECC02_003000 [Trypanosoma cruzi]